MNSKNRLRVLIDMQGAQSSSRHRGIGTYSVAFAEAVLNRNQDFDVFLLVNGAFPESVVHLRKKFHNLLSPDRFVLWYPIEGSFAFNSKEAELSTEIRDAVIKSINPDLVHFTSVFEGFAEPAYTQVTDLGGNIAVTATLYDLIPLEFPDEYLLHVDGYQEFYRSRLESLAICESLLAISEHSAQMWREFVLDQKDKEISVVHGSLPSSRLAKHEAPTKDSNTIDLLFIGGAEPRKRSTLLASAARQVAQSVTKKVRVQFVGDFSDGQRRNLSQLAGKSVDVLFHLRLSESELQAIYQKCSLVVLPSIAEGLGLPILEAARFDTGVVCANSSALPEFVGVSEFLFEPDNESALAERIVWFLNSLQDLVAYKSEFIQFTSRFSLENFGLKIASAWGEVFSSQGSTQEVIGGSRLALVTPWPPQKSGVATFACNLARILSLKFEVTVIVEKSDLFDEGYQFQTISWFAEHHGVFDHVLYQFGNSPFHWFMVEAMQTIPGVVELHDVYVGDLLHWVTVSMGRPDVIIDAAIESSGILSALAAKSNPTGLVLSNDLVLSMVQQSKGLIVHSEFAARILESRYILSEEAISVIGLLANKRDLQSREQARLALGLRPETLLIASFGFVDRKKLNKEILNACTELKDDGLEIQLVFVGENHGGGFGREFQDLVAATTFASITGYVDEKEYERYLAATDIAIQLRTESRGESSAAAIDALRAGIPTIVSGEGSFVELGKLGAIVLKNSSQDQLLRALRKLGRERERQAARQKSNELVEAQLSDDKILEQYFEALAIASQSYSSHFGDLVSRMRASYSEVEDVRNKYQIVKSIDTSWVRPVSKPIIYLDVTGTEVSSLATGIERVVVRLVEELVTLNPEDFAIFPVKLVQVGNTFRYEIAESVLVNTLGIDMEVHTFAPLRSPRLGDFVLVLDISGASLIQAANTGYFEIAKAAGAHLSALIYDVLPLTNPEFFPPGAQESFAEWLAVFDAFDQLFFISNNSMEEYRRLKLSLSEGDQIAKSVLPMGWDFTAKSSLPRKGATNVSSKKKRFLMVGTLEPRKGHEEVLGAFEKLWDLGLDFELAIVGREGWRHLPRQSRKKIHDLVERISSHSQLGEKLFWLNDLDDSQLMSEYSRSYGVILGSHAEGFGLPLIEALATGTPVLARDIPIFREIAPTGVQFFSENQLVTALQAFRPASPPAGLLPTWGDSASWLLKNLNTGVSRIR